MMTILEQVKLLLNLSDTDKDNLLNLYIDICRDEATDYCNLNEYSSKLDSAVVQMVIEKYNQCGSEGLTSITSSGIKEEYSSGYSDAVILKLTKNRKVKCV